MKMETADCCGPVMVEEEAAREWIEASRRLDQRRRDQFALVIAQGYAANYFAPLDRPETFAARVVEATEALVRKLG